MKMQTNKSKYEIDMCNGPILKKMLIFSIPLMCSSILQLLFNAADIVVVGHFASDNSLAAVGSTTSLVALMTNLFIGLSVGANVVTANFYGAKKKADLKTTVHTAMLLSIYSGILLTFIGILGAKQILIWMQTPDEVLNLAVVYLRIYFAGMTATMIYNFGSAILRAVGDTKRPLYFLFIAGIINVVLNLFFVIVLRLDVAGVALATVTSQCISAYLIVRCLIKEKSDIRLDLKQLHINRRTLLKILKIGLPAGLQTSLFSFANVIIQSSVNSFGAAIIAGNSASANIEGFIYVSVNAFYQATLSFTSQNIGAGKKHRINRILFCGQLCACIIGLLLGNISATFSKQLLHIYTSKPAEIAAGMNRMKTVCRTYALCGMMDVMAGSVRGLGHSVMPMLVALIGACGLRLLWLATMFQMDQFHNVTTIYLSYPISWGITLLAHAVCFIIVRRKLN